MEILDQFSAVVAILSLVVVCSLPMSAEAGDQPWNPVTLQCTPWSWQTCHSLRRGEFKVGVNKEGGGGMQAPDHFVNGEFSLDMKLPPGNSGGTLFAWYLMSTVSKSNKDPLHSEIDLEFFGNTTSATVMLATNVFANSKQNLAQFNLPFDPTAGYHTYTMRWTPTQIVWIADGNVLRVLDKVPGRPWPMHAMRPMASVWATPWSALKADFSNGPIYAWYKGYRAEGCKVPATAVQKASGAMCGPAIATWNQNIDPRSKEMVAYKAYHAKTLIVDYGWDNV